MSRYSERLLRSSIDLAARQWNTLGTALAGEAQAANVVIDPEALILFTASLGDADPRLRDESTDWCVRYGGRLISASRLRNLRTAFPPELAATIDEYLSTVNAHGATRWPVAGSRVRPRTFEPSKKSKLPALFKRGALLRLQLRSLFGVTARAEILLSICTDKKRFRSASELTSTGYSKRNIALVLDDLARSEVVSTKKIGNRIGFQLKKLAELRQLAPGLGTAELARWDVRLAILVAALRLVDRIESKRPIVRSVEARQFVADHTAGLDAMESKPPDHENPEAYFEEFATWALDSLVPPELR